MSARDAFLSRVREAVRAGNRAGTAPPLPVRGDVGYQGAGSDVLERFCTEFRAAGGSPNVVSGIAEASARILEIVRAKAAKRVLLGTGRLLDRLDLKGPLNDDGVEVVAVASLAPGSSREAFFAADLGITEPDYLVAETGSIVQKARPAEPRSSSLLPPVHVVVADKSHLLPDLFDLFAALGGAEGETVALPSCVTLITGPSKTGDVELKLVTGVHGPGEVHAVLVAP